MEVYDIHEIISYGAYGIVVRASLKNDSDAQYAIKFIAGIRMNKLRARQFMREILILKQFREMKDKGSNSHTINL